MELLHFVTRGDVATIATSGFVGFIIGFALAYIILRKRMNNNKAQRQVTQVNVVFLVAALFYILTPLIGLGEPRSEVLIFILALASGDAIGGVATKILEKYGVNNDKDKRRK